MNDFEEQLNLLLKTGNKIYSPVDISILGRDITTSQWINDVEIFYNNYLEKHPLGPRMRTLLIHRSENVVGELLSCLQSIKNDRSFMDKMNGIQSISVPKYQAKTIPEYDVFISHANKDKEDLIEKWQISVKAQLDVIENMYGTFHKATLEDFDIMIPHSKYIHGKFYYINEEEKDTCIPYEKIVEKIKALGFNGHIAAEYEGHFSDGTVDCVEQLGRYSRMMHKLLA